MLDFLDIKTLCFITSIISLVLYVCMLYVYKTRKTYNGFNLWVIASMLYFFAFVLMSLRNILPDFFSIIVSNTLIIAGIGYVAHGIEIFTSSKKRLWLFLTSTLLVAVFFTYFTYVHPSVSIRIVIISIVIALVYFYSAFVLHNSTKSWVWMKSLILVIAFSFQAIWNLLRVIETILYEKHLIDFFGASAFHGTTIAVFFCGNILVSIGLIVLNFQRVEKDFTEANSEVNKLRGIIPICSECKVIRNDKGAWVQLEQYISERSDAKFSHGICDNCLEKHYAEED